MNPHLTPSVPLPSTPHTSPQGTGGPPTAAGQHHESGGVVAAFDHGDGQVQRGSGPDDQTPDLTAVDPDQPDRGEPPAQGPPAAGAHRRSHGHWPGDAHREQQPEGVHGDVPRAAADHICAIETPGGRYAIAPQRNRPMASTRAPSGHQPVIRALLAAEVKALADEVLDAGYAELAQIYGSAEERRTARDRYVARTDATA